MSRRPVQHTVKRDAERISACSSTGSSLGLIAMVHAQGETSSMSGATSGIASDEVSIPTAVEK